MHYGCMHMHKVYAKPLLIREATFLQLSIKNSDLQNVLNLATHYFYYFHRYNCCHCILLV